MPKISKTNSEYNLLKSFYDFKGMYKFNSGDGLALWLQMNDPLPVDNSAMVPEPSISLDSGNPEVKTFSLRRKFNSAKFNNATADGGYSILETNGRFSFSSAADGASSSSTSDLPFSISFLVYVEQGTAGTAITKGSPTSTQGEYSVLLTSNVSSGNREVVFYLYDGTSAKYSAVRATLVANYSDGDNPGFNKWYHVVCTYDGRGSSSHPYDGMNVYVNGQKTNYATLSFGSYVGMRPVYSNPLAIGQKTSVIEFDGELAEFAMWNRALSQSDATALYDYTVLNSGEIKSGILNNPVRTIIKDADDQIKTYPTILRTTGRTTTMGRGNGAPLPYNDTRFITFLTQSQYSNVKYPLGLQDVDAKKYYRNIVPEHNVSGSIFASGSTKSFINEKFLGSGSIIGIPNEPFDESRIYLDADEDWYMTGTANNFYPGFSSPLDDKVQIRIPILSKEVSYASRWNSTEMYGNEEGKNFGADGEFPNSKFSGFLYYNKDTQRWDHMGLSDPATGADTHYNMWVGEVNPNSGLGIIKTVGARREDYFTVNTYRTTPNTPKKYQFSMGRHSGWAATSYNDLKDAHGYKKIGAPTMSGDGPFHSTYHATGSNTFKMSDYIAHPLVLEKIEIEIPITVRMRRANYPSGAPSLDDVIYFGGLRDIDNYVFFLYRQSRAGNFEKDSIADCDTSMRYLIASASVAAVNKSVFNSDVQAGIEKYGLPHNPNVTIDLSHSITGGLAGAQLNHTFTGSLRIKMIPAVPSRQFNGSSRLPSRFIYTTPSNKVTFLTGSAGSVNIQDFWGGGTTFPSASRYLDFDKEIPFGSFAAVASSGMYRYDQIRTDQPTPPGYNFNASLWPVTPGQVHSNKLFWYSGNSTAAPVITSDTVIRYQGYTPFNSSRPGFTQELPTGIRPLRSFAGESTSVEDIIVHSRQAAPGISGVSGHWATMGDKPTSIPSPYVLLPDDEIIIGIDAGIASAPTTGSYTKLKNITHLDDLTPPIGLPDPRPAGMWLALRGSAKTSTNGVWGSLPSNMIQNISGSFLSLETGEASITLFGSLVREGVEQMSELNQPLVTNAIHEDLHYDNIISDQFLIEDRSEISGSYSDRLIVGTISGSIDPSYAYGRGTGGIEDTWKLRRGDIGSLAGKSAFHSLTDLFYKREGATTAMYPDADVHGKTLRNVILAAGYHGQPGLRFIRHRDPSERFWDTLMPDITDYGRRSGFEVSYDRKDQRYFITGTLRDKYQGSLITQSGSYLGTGKYIANIHAYPYKTDVPRKLFDATDIRGYNSWGSIPGGSNTFIAAYGDIAITNSPTVTAPWTLSESHLLINGSINALLRDTILFQKGYDIAIYEKNNFFRLIFNGGVKGSGGSRHGFSAAGAPYINIPGGKAWGYAYGIKNTRPEFSSAVFRKDCYGQFRDMLEQRSFAKFYIYTDDLKSINRDTKSNSSYESSGFGEAEGIIKNHFVNAIDGVSLVNPYTTQCVNVDHESSSSCPYTDGHACNIADVTDTYVIVGPVCVAEGTMILTNRGEIPVQDVIETDRLVSYDFNKSDFKSYKIEAFFKSKSSKNMKIETEFGHDIVCSIDHPFVTWKSDNKEVRAKDFRPGDPIYTCNMGSLVSDSIKSVEYIEKEINVYNFTVDIIHTYISNGILSHNIGPTYSPTTGDAGLSFNVTRTLQKGAGGGGPISVPLDDSLLKIL